MIATIQGDGGTFLVACVAENALLNKANARATRDYLEQRHGLPVLLIGDRKRNSFGDPDLARALQRYGLNRIQWRG